MIDISAHNSSLIDNSITGEKLEAAVQSLKPLRDLARNWDIDIATW